MVLHLGLFVTCEKKIFSLVCWSVCLSKRLFWGVGNHLKHVKMQKKKNFFLGGVGGGVGNHFGGVGNHLKHVEMQKKKNFFVCLFVCLLQFYCG